MQQFTAFEYLLIDTANNFGTGTKTIELALDKQLYAQRIEWTRANLDNLEALVQLADSPNMYWKSVDAIRCAQAGIATGHLVGFDSAASGIQLLSVMARCNTGMINTGVINSLNATQAPDIYKKCTGVMNRTDYLRKAIKNALMTYMYGSEQQPKIVFGEGTDLELFYKAAQVVAPEAYDMRNILINTFQANVLAHTWPMPDRGIIHKRVWVKKEYKVQEPLLGSSFTFHTSVNEGKERGVNLAADVTHGVDAYVVRELTRRCNFDVIQLNQCKELILMMRPNCKVTNRTIMMSLVEVDFLNEGTIATYTDNQLAQLLEQIETSLRFGSFETVTIHDEFKCHANNMNALRKHYNIILWELYHSNLLADIIFHLSGQRLNILPFDEDVAALILESDYALN